MQRNLVLLLLKFHFDDVYYARVVSDLEDAEIDAEGHKCHKRKKLAWIASSICEWVFPPHLYVYNFNLNGNKEDSFLCFFSCFHIKNILAFYFLVIASIYNWLWCIHVFFYSLHTFIYTLNDNKIFPRKWYLLFCVKIWYLARKYRECLEQADHLFFSRRILKIN